MNTLIAYATKHGSVRKCAEMLAKKLTGAADLHNLDSGSGADLSKYERVIIGGSIYAGRIQKSVTDFCAKNANELKNKKLGLYILCMDAKSAMKELETAYPKELVDLAKARDCFGGEFRFSDMNFMEKTIVKMISKALSKEDKSMAFDTKQDVSAISEDKIANFAELMNIG